MPFVYITTNVPRAKMPKDFNKLATTKFAQLIGQPEEYMAIIVNAGADLAMCGTEEPAAVLNVRAMGAFTPEKNGDLFKQAADFFHDTLGIKICRTYSEFVEYDPAFVGVCGMTLKKVHEMMMSGNCPEVCVCGEKHDCKSREEGHGHKKH